MLKKKWKKERFIAVILKIKWYKNDFSLWSIGFGFLDFFIKKLKINFQGK